MLHDSRTKPESQWTYYVVDHLPTMANIYRYDTVEEAIQKYSSLPDMQKSAIGSSIGGVHEIDHIHRCDGKSVLVMDSANLSLWRESQEVQSAIDTMIGYLNVQHQMSNLFGRSVMVDLDRYKERTQDPYLDYKNKILQPEDPKDLLTSIQDIYVEGSGWLNRIDFLKMLEDSRPSRPGVGAKNLFVERLNINYVDESGSFGQADVSILQFSLLKEKTEHLLSPEKLASDLYDFAQSVEPNEVPDQEDVKDPELELIRSDIASGGVYPYITYVSKHISEGFASEEERKKAISLAVRLKAISPKEFRKPSLAKLLHSAQQEAQNQQGRGNDIRRGDAEHGIS